MRFQPEQIAVAAAALRPLGWTREEAIVLLWRQFAPLFQALASAEGACLVCGLLSSHSKAVIERTFETQYLHKTSDGLETASQEWRAGRVCPVEPGLDHQLVWEPYVGYRPANLQKQRLCELAVQGLVRMVVGKPVIGMVACSATKLATPAPAHDLYQGQLFKLSRAYAERWCHGWNILSAHWTMISHDKVIEPYDYRLGSKEDDRFHWDLAVAVDAMQMFNDCHLVVLGGQQYTGWTRNLERFPMIKPHVRFTLETPLAGLGIGQMKKWLAERIKGMR